MTYRILIFSFIVAGILFTRPVVSNAQKSASPQQSQANGIDWRGVYHFGEVGGKNTGMVIDYSITVYQKDGRLVADLDADGFQTLTRISCAVKTSGNKLELFFANYRKDNLYEIYKPGELLLSLEMRGGKLLTYWASVTPQLRGVKNGKVYFTKQTRRSAPGK